MRGIVKRWDSEQKRINELFLSKLELSSTEGGSPINNKAA